MLSIWTDVKISLFGKGLRNLGLLKKFGFSGASLLSLGYYEIFENLLP